MDNCGVFYIKKLVLTLALHSDVQNLYVWNLNRISGALAASSAPNVLNFGGNFSSPKPALSMANLSARSMRIKTLNDLVRTLALNAVATAKTRGEEVEVDVVWALKPKTVMTAGFPVYEERSGLVVACLTLLSSYMILLGALELGAAATVFNLAVAFFSYDLFSGVLHIVLDDPHNLDVPLLGQPALEFQWHHRLPHDITAKDFTDVVRVSLSLPLSCTLLVCLS